MKQNNLTKILPVFGVLSLFFLVSCAPPTPEEIDILAGCLTEKGAVMYGASWCPHCTAQKEAFGAAFSKIKYVECEEQKQKCAEETIAGLPTWKFADGSRLEGEQEFKTLAKKTGCEI